MKKLLFASVCILLSFVSCKISKQNPVNLTFSEAPTKKYTTVTDITVNDIHWHISVLASDSMQGRKAGTLYDSLAAQYIREEFQSLGLKAFDNNYYQTFPVFTRKYFHNCDLYFENCKGEFNKDFRPVIMFDSITVSAEAAFAGYGYESDYNNLDVKDKWVMIFEGNNSETTIPKSKEDFYTRYTNANKRGALGVLAIVIDETFNDELSYLRSTPSSKPVIKISPAMTDRLLAHAGVTFSEVLTKIKAGESPVMSVPVMVNATVQSKAQQPLSQNVIAYLEASHPESDEYIVIGAHYDHIGTQTANDTTLICNGADDNASGVAGLLEIAERLASEDTLKYNVLFTAFGAEEAGLVGSTFFCKNPPVPLEKIKLMVNMDMIGRMDSCNHAYIQTVLPTDIFNTVIDEVRELHPDINVNISSEYKFSASDHLPFFNNNIPALSFTTGLHDAYHTPADTLGSINCKGEKRLLNFIYDFILKEGGR